MPFSDTEYAFCKTDLNKTKMLRGDLRKDLDFICLRFASISMLATGVRTG